jgi:LPS sulfotransferase NodH
MAVRDRLERPLVFIGPGRSGSTVISEVVLAHEQLGWPSNYLEYRPRSAWVNLANRLLDNGWWRLVGEKSQLNRTRHLNTLLPRPAEAYPFWAALTGPDVDFARGFLLDRRPTPAARERVRRTLRRMLAWQGKPRLGMKFTGPGRIGYLSALFPGARFVNVVRDPVATVQSLLKVPFWAQQGMHRLWWTGAYSDAELADYAALRDDPVASTAFQLGKILRTTRAEAAACGVPMLTVAYEEFVARPRETVAQVLEFAGLPPSRWIERKLDGMQVHDRNRAAILDAQQVRLVTSLT